MAEETDPFTEAGDAIFAALLDFAPFADAILPGNRIENDDRGVLKARISRAPADWPQVRVAQGGFAMTVGGRNSMSAEAVQVYNVLLLTDNKTTIPVNVLKWHAFRALVRVESPNLGLAFVRSWRIRNAQDFAPGAGAAGAENPGDGWNALLAVEVEMNWSRAELRA